MPLKESYVIWNNKGGVGKSTLTFHIASHYSRPNPTEKVLVIDLCPQANVSMALLSSRRVPGSEHLSTLYNANKTISFYLQRSIEPGPVIKGREYLTAVHDFNDQMPSNLFFLCGDMYLELVGRHLEHERSGVVLTRNNPWVDTTSSIKSFIEGKEGRVTGVTEIKDETEVNEDWVVFVDTNPAFSVYTEIALAAAKKLIIPINADDFSVAAVRAMLDLVYGIRQRNDEPEDFQAYREYMFSSKAAKYGLRRPQIHLLVNNRTTHLTTQTQAETRAVKGFRAMGQKNLQVLFDACRDHQENFTPRDEMPEINTIDKCQQLYFEDIRDFHTKAILCLHTGCPLGALSGTVDFADTGASVKVDQKKKKTYLECLERLVGKL